MPSGWLSNYLLALSSTLTDCTSTESRCLIILLSILLCSWCSATNRGLGETTGQLPACTAFVHGIFPQNLVRQALCISYVHCCLSHTYQISHADSRTQWGSTSAISDITPAAGWKITSCDPNATAPDIELTCPNSSSHCDHLFQGGVVHTVVRLPETVSFLLILAFSSVLTHADCGTTCLAVRSDAFCARSEALDQ